MPGSDSPLLEQTRTGPGSCAARPSSSSSPTARVPEYGTESSASTVYILPVGTAPPQLVINDNHALRRHRSFQGRGDEPRESGLKLEGRKYLRICVEFRSRGSSI